MYVALPFFAVKPRFVIAHALCNKVTLFIKSAPKIKNMFHFP